MDIFSFMNGLKGEMLRQKLLAIGVDPNDMAGIDFNNMSDLNLLAERIVPKMLKANPNIASLIKQNSSMLGEEKSKEVCEVIDMG